MPDEALKKELVDLMHLLKVLKENFALPVTEQGKQARDRVDEILEQLADDTDWSFLKDATAESYAEQFTTGGFDTLNPPRNPEAKAPRNTAHSGDEANEADDLDWTEDKPEGDIPFYCPLCGFTIEKNATYDGVFQHNKQLHNMSDENAEILAKGFTYSNGPPTSKEASEPATPESSGDWFDNLDYEKQKSILRRASTHKPEWQLFYQEVTNLENHWEELYWDDIPSDLQWHIETEVRSSWESKESSPEEVWCDLNNQWEDEQSHKEHIQRQFGEVDPNIHMDDRYGPVITNDDFEEKSDYQGESNSSCPRCGSTDISKMMDDGKVVYGCNRCLNDDSISPKDALFKATEGGQGSGRKYHQQWMNPTDKINSISPDNMKRAKFLERANEIAIEYSDEKTWKQIFEALKD